MGFTPNDPWTVKNKQINKGLKIKSMPESYWRICWARFGTDRNSALRVFFPFRIPSFTSSKAKSQTSVAPPPKHQAHRT